MKTKKNIKYALESIRKDIFSSVFRMIQILAAYIVIGFMIMEGSGAVASLSILNKITADKEIYVLKDESYGSYYHEDYSKEVDTLVDMILEKDISIIFKGYSAKVPQYGMLDCIAVTPDFFDRYDIKIEGCSENYIQENFKIEKITEKDMEERVFPAIAGYNLKKYYSVGDIVESTDLKWKIIGFASKKGGFILPMRGKEVEYVDDSIIYPYFIDVDDGSNMLRLFDSCMFNGTPKSEIEEIVKYNNDNKLYNLSIKSYGEQIKYIKKTISNSMLFYAFFGIALLAFSIIGMTGTMIVRVIDNLYEYTVNLMCGATLNDIYDRITYEFFITFFIGIMGCLYFFGYTLPTVVALLISQISYTGMRVYLRRHLDFEVLTKTMARK